MVDLISLSFSINLYASTVLVMFSSSFSLPFLSFGFSFSFQLYYGWVASCAELFLFLFRWFFLHYWIFKWVPWLFFLFSSYVGKEHLIEISSYVWHYSLSSSSGYQNQAIGSEDDKISYSFWVLSIFMYLWRRRWVFSFLFSVLSKELCCYQCCQNRDPT